jgi:hypothetical protein
MLENDNQMTHEFSVKHNLGISIPEYISKHRSWNRTTDVQDVGPGRGADKTILLGKWKNFNMILKMIMTKNIDKNYIEIPVFDQNFSSEHQPRPYSYRYIQTAIII